MEWTHRSLGSLGVAAALALVPLSGSADTADQPFLVTTTQQTPNNTTSHRAVLLVHADGAPSDDASTPRDRSCYAVVQRVLAAGAARTPYVIGIVLDDDTVVNVPMTASLAQPAAGARLIYANGSAIGELVGPAVRVPIGIRIEAHVLAQNGHLEAATFSESTYVTTPSQPVEVSGCAMQRLPAQPVSSGTDVSPA
jgi:hypothetical protein